MTRDEVEKSLKKAGYEVFREKRLPNESGDQLRLVSPQIVNVFDTGTVTVQGKPGRDLRELLSSSNEPAVRLTGSPYRGGALPGGSGVFARPIRHGSAPSSCPPCPRAVRAGGAPFPFGQGDMP
jgi:predicted RNA binding protein YcfA (HicA-like mRNA interferase family)